MMDPALSPQRPWSKARFKLIRWLFFTLASGLLPVLVNLAPDVFAGGRDVSFTKSVAHGELLLLAAALSGGAIGELIGLPLRRFRSYVTAIGGLNLVLFFVATVAFSSVSGNADAVDAVVARSSAIILGATAFVGVQSVVIAELARH